ncbi:MAG: PEP-CTERM sorting domain-containing protein [Pirellulales bacterium]
MNVKPNLRLPCRVALPLVVMTVTIAVTCPTTMLTASTSELLADINDDGEVNVIDVCIMSSNWGMEGLGFSQGDIDGDNFIDGRDLGIMIENWTGSRGARIPEPSALFLSALAAVGLLMRRR